jgi:protein-glucosylgalactosylhydroxylysine glucosidase
MDDGVMGQMLHRICPHRAYVMSHPISPPTVTTSGTDDLPAYVSNGFIGLRVLDLPLLPGVVMVSGFAGLHSEMEIEAAAEAPYPVAGDLVLNGVRLTEQPHQAEFIDQRYDFSNGELTTRFRFMDGGATATVEVLTFCSRERPTLVLQEVAVEVDRAADVELRALVDTTRIQGRMASRHAQTPGKDAEEVDGSLEWEALGGRSTVGVAYVTELLGDAEATREIAKWGIDSDLATDYKFRAYAGRRYRLRQIAAVVPSVVHHDPDHQALRLVGRAKDAGWDRLRDENRAQWDDLWRGRVLIDAEDGRWQELADAAFFYLNTSVHPSAPASTSMYGLAKWNNYHYYYGHVMWDIEFFGVPPLFFAQPDAARSLLEYRSQTIDAARSNAKLNGRKGLQFPWESGSVYGEESSPGVGRASWHEDHASLDVAWAFAQYAHATGDRRFLAEDASRVLYGVADWATSRITKTRHGYAWNETMGIAERERPSDNEAFTIMIAKVVLGEAIACAERLGHTVPERWRDVRGGLAPRQSRHTGGVMSHDGFHPLEEKGATPGPLAGIFPVWFDLDPAVEQATLRYFLDLAPAYVGSPMLSPLYGVWAAWAGDRRLSARLLDEGYAQLIGPRFTQTLEQHPGKFPENPPSGPFFANIGGFLMGLMHGFPGLRLTADPPATWPARPVTLPAGWRSIEIERAWIHGRPARIVAPHGAERAEIIQGGRSRRVSKAA